MKIALVATVVVSSLGTASGFVGGSHFGVRPSTRLLSSIGINAADQRWAAPTSKRTPTNKAKTPAAMPASATMVQQELRFQIRNAHLIFSVIDVDGSGTLSKAELSEHLLKAGYPERTVAQIFQKMDVNKDGEISRKEFELAMTQSLKALQTAPGLGSYNAQFVKEIIEDADQVFQSMDADNNGELDALEMKSHMGRMWTSYSEKAIDTIFRTLDVNGDQKISREEFRDAFLRHSALRQVIGEGPNFK